MAITKTAINKCIICNNKSFKNCEGGNMFSKIIPPASKFCKISCHKIFAKKLPPNRVVFAKCLTPIVKFLKKTISYKKIYNSIYNKFIYYLINIYIK